MARPVEFDRDEALEAALKLFWSQGYAATSVSALLEAMGIGRSSFYAGFGDKRSLYVEVLRLFSDRTLQILLDARREAGALDAVRRFFYGTLLEVPRARCARGCLMVNSVLELAEVDPALRALASDELAAIERGFESCFEAAQAAGVYPRDRSPRDLAAHVMLINQGLRVASRERVPRKELGRRIDTALSLMGIPAAE